jgi:hypothetical protein
LKFEDVINAPGIGALTQSEVNTVTVTHHNSINYGAVLQSYALQKYLSKLGVSDEILDLKRTHGVYFREFGSGGMVLSDLYNNFINLLCVGTTFKRIKKFREFVRDNIKVTRYFSSVQEVLNNPPGADAYITGSDQTFNTESPKKECNFLKFGDVNIKRISYAASLGGQPKVEEQHLQEFISDVRKYTFLSVREQCSADYISKLCSINCETHVDPVFLLTKNEWSELASKSKTRRPVRQDYILVYLLVYNPLLNDAVRKIKKETGLDVIVINPSSRCYAEGDRIIRDAGPLEFLNLFENAAYIFTTTFHGVCFSVIFEKPFFTFISLKNEIRINGLLNSLGLNDRIISDVSKPLCGKISYEVVNEIIGSERRRADEYLRKALSI